MATRGRKPSVSVDQKINILIKHRILKEDGTLDLTKELLSEACDDINKMFNPNPAMTIRNLTLFATRYLENQMLKKNKAVAEKRQITQSSCNTKKVVQKSCDDEKNLLVLQNNILYKPIIRELATYPFTTFHWSIEGVDFASYLSEDNKFMFGLVGLFCKSFVAPDGNSSNDIDLYALGVAVDEKFFPICQMSTENASPSLLQRFFGENLKSTLAIPSSLTLDHNYDHLIAANFVFNINLSFENYLTACLKCLCGETDCLPRCIFFTNVRLIILKIERSQCFATIKLPSVKKFFLCCIVLLSQQNNFMNFQMILQKIFVIACSKYGYTIFNSCFNEIREQIKISKIEETFTSNYLDNIKNKLDHMLNTESDPKIKYDLCMDIRYVILKTFVEAQKLVDDCEKAEKFDEGQEHAYYNEMFCKVLMKICIEFPVWTKIMSSVPQKFERIDAFEPLLENYRTVISENAEIDSIDKCLLKNIKYIENHLQILYESFDKSNCERKPIDDIERSLHAGAENWDGKNPEENQIEEEDYCSESDSELREFSMGGESDRSTTKMMDVRKLVESMCSNLKQGNLSTDDVSGSLHSFKQCSEGDKVQNASEKSSFEQSNQSCSKPAKATKQRSKGKYLGPYFEFEIFEQNALKFPKKRCVIKNIIFYKPRSVKKIKQFFVTSSHIDSILEMFTSSFYHNKSFRQFIELTCQTDTLQQDVAQFLTLIHAYSSKMNMNSLNSERVKIMVNILDKNERKKWTWMHEIGLLYEKIMPPSILSKSTCSSCKQITYHHFNHVKLSVDEILSEQCRKALIKLKLGTMCLCQCNNKLSIDNVELGTVLCYNLENSDESTECNRELCILPSHQYIGMQSFILAGVIAYQEPLVETDPRHYIAYTRSRTDDSWIWVEYDNGNVKKKPKRVKKTLKLNLALVLYIEINHKRNSDVVSLEDETEGQLSNNKYDNEQSIYCSQSPTIHETQKDNSNSSLILSEDENEKCIQASTPKRETFSGSFDSGSIKDDSTNHHLPCSRNNFLDISLHDRELIKNGSIVGEQVHVLNNNKPGKFSLKKFIIKRCSFKGTGSFDSCLEVIASMYLDSKEFKTLIDDVVEDRKPTFFSMLKEYCANLNVEELYSERVRYLYQLVKDNIDLEDAKIGKRTYNCKMNVVQMFKKMMEEEPCYIKRKVCNGDYCSFGQGEEHFSVQLTPTQFHTDGIENLNLYLDAIFRDRENESCNGCKHLTFYKENTVETIWDLSSYFTVDVEYVSEIKNYPFFIEFYPELANHVFDNFTNFTRIPTKLQIRGIEFHLKGAVCFTDDPPIETKDPPPCRYYSYVLNEENRWVKYDNLENSITVMDTAPKEKLALILYARANEVES